MAWANAGPDSSGPSSNGDRASSLLFGGTEGGMGGGSIIKTRHQHLFRMHEMRSRGRVQPSVKDGGRTQGRSGGMDGAREGGEGRGASRGKRRRKSWLHDGGDNHPG